MNVEIENLCKSFGDKKVLENLSLTFEDKKSTCIMASSGWGKTTLLNILMGFTQQDSGSVKGISGQKISAVFQENRLCENLSVKSNLKLVCAKELQQEISPTLQALFLADCINKPVYTLSGGMKRRVAIARAIITPADIYLFDEPFKGLDDELKRHVMLYVKEKLLDKTLVWVTHDIREAEFMQSRILTLNQGLQA